MIPGSLFSESVLAKCSKAVSAAQISSNEEFAGDHSQFPIEVPEPKNVKLVSAASSSFRHDINGLRAWAVVAVILYHFGIPGFSGGFVGVDVFFVISGYLMTGIVVAGLERGGFSLWEIGRSHV